MMLMDDMLFADGSEFRIGSIVPILNCLVTPMIAATMITFTVMSSASTRQVTTRESMLPQCDEGTEADAETTCFIEKGT